MPNPGSLLHAFSHPLIYCTPHPPASPVFCDSIVTQSHTLRAFTHQAQVTPGTPTYCTNGKPLLGHTWGQVKFESSFSLWPLGEWNATNSPESLGFVICLQNKTKKTPYTHTHIFTFTRIRASLYELESSSGVNPRGDGSVVQRC